MSLLTLEGGGRVRRRQKSRDVGGGAFLLPPPPPSPFATVSDGEERKKRPPPPPPQTRKVDWNHPAWLVGWLADGGKRGPFGKVSFQRFEYPGGNGKASIKAPVKIFESFTKKRGERRKVQECPKAEKVPFFPSSLCLHRRRRINYAPRL